MDDDEGGSYYATPFGMLDFCLTVTVPMLIDEHVRYLNGLSDTLSELADEAPPDLALKLRTLAAVVGVQRDDLDALLEVL